MPLFPDGRQPGRYNVVEAGEYDTFDHQIPVDEFVDRLERGEVPDDVCVVGLDEAFADEERIAEISRVIDRHGDDLEMASATIQFVVDDLRVGVDQYDVVVDGERYSLDRVLKQPQDEADDWVVAPF